MGNIHSLPPQFHILSRVRAVESVISDPSRIKNLEELGLIVLHDCVRALGGPQYHYLRHRTNDRVQRAKLFDYCEVTRLSNY